MSANLSSQLAVGTLVDVTLTTSGEALPSPFFDCSTYIGPPTISILENNQGITSGGRGNGFWVVASSGQVYLSIGSLTFYGPTGLPVISNINNVENTGR